MKLMILLLVFASSVGFGFTASASGAERCACPDEKCSVAGTEGAGRQAARDGDLPRRPNRDWQ